MKELIRWWLLRLICFALRVDGLGVGVRGVRPLVIDPTEDELDVIAYRNNL